MREKERDMDLINLKLLRDVHTRKLVFVCNTRKGL